MDKNDRSPGDRILLGFPECEEAAARVARAAGIGFARVDVHRFPDGESLVRVPDPLPRRCTLYRSLDRPNDKLVELMLCAAACRDQGVEDLTLLAPYLCYMRQDIAFEKGQAVSQRVVGGWLGSAFDRVVTVDPHLHRVDALDAALPGMATVKLGACRDVAAYLGTLDDQLVLLGPDEESAQWVEPVAASLGMPWTVAVKRRSGDRSVRVALPGDFRCAGARVVLLDDVASTGQTLAAAARGVLQNGASRVSCLVTHPVFCDGALEVLREAGVADVWSTDSIVHPTNVVSLSGLLAGVL